MADPQTVPALLVSYFYLKGFLKNRSTYIYRDWVMDSGAYSASNSGATIKLADYVDTCRKLLDEDPKLSEVFCLDVIGDWKASEKNCRAMWKAGIEAIPCWHKGEPWDVLIGLARDYPKIAIGGFVSTHAKEKLRIVDQVFARVWPKAIHGFGMCTERLALGYPFHSLDASTWETGPCAFGRWMAFGNMSIRGGSQNLRAEVDWYLNLEKKAQRRWSLEMQQLSVKPRAPTVRLAHNGDERGAVALSPSLRLAIASNRKPKV